jgi:transaldolase / glucose-6-phosphate isomerase
MNPLKALQDFGQSVWLDFIRRNLIKNGDLKRLIDEDGLRGVTSNPSIFEKAIAGSTDYSDSLAALEKQKDAEPMALYEALAIKDIQDAADIMRTVYDGTKRRDGYISLEVSPYLANDTKATIEEARRLWKKVGRPNVMIKVPGTEAGLPAIRTLIGEGINVNVTLLFAQSRYEQVADAFIAGVAALAKSGGDISKIASVASFFVSRIDTLVDSIIDKRLAAGPSAADKATLATLKGKVAVANARLVYQKYKSLYKAEPWQALAQKGAQSQRLLWASTSTKNPAYSDIMYVEDLIGPDTVNTIPPATMDAFRDHGKPRASLEANLDEAHDTMNTLAHVGISMKEVTDQLVEEGVKLFADAFDKLLAAVDKGRKSQLTTMIDRQTRKLPPDLEKQVKATLDDWRENGKVRRLWAHDASLWTGTDEGNWLGWLGITEDQLAHIGALKAIAEDARTTGFTHALLLGMGGSSLCPEVMAKTFGKLSGRPQLHVLDSTDPAQIKAIEESIDLKKTLFIVSSKSGSTLEPNIFKQYFMERARSVLGAEAPKHFIAVTDPGSKLQQIAESEGFRNVFFGVPSIGGRYSALSNFGMVPAAVMGVDVARFLDGVDLMVHSCRPSVPADENPGVVLGAIMGTLANRGRDKVTIITSPAIFDLGAWLEQLLAESTGKQGKGLIPVDRERLGAPDAYGNDRLFAYIRLDKGADPKQDAAVDALEKAGHPVVRIALADTYDIGQEFFRWEVATAVAGSIIGIDAFNQPDVEAAKVEARKLTNEYEQKGSLPAEKPIIEDGGFKLYSDPRNAAELAKAAGGDKTAAGYLRAHLGRLRAGDYFATLAYVRMNEAHEQELQAMRHAVRDSRRVATCLGFGPRFQHSTGQAYKGGPNSGVFLQITCDDAVDLPVPQQKYTFGVVKAAQARGDLQVLADRGRRALRVHIGSDVKAGLAALTAAVTKALR